MCYGPEESNKTVQNIKNRPLVLWLIVRPTYCFISVIASECIPGIAKKPIRKTKILFSGPVCMTELVGRVPDKLNSSVPQHSELPRCPQPHK